MSNLIKGAWGWCDERYCFSSNSRFLTSWDISLISDKLHCGWWPACVATVGFLAFHPQIRACAATDRAGQLRLAPRAEPTLWRHVSILWPGHTFPGQADPEEPRGAEPCVLRFFPYPHPEHRLCRSPDCTNLIEPYLFPGRGHAGVRGGGTPQGARGCQEHLENYAT